MNSAFKIIDHRYIYECASKLKYFITIKFGNSKKLYEKPMLVIKLNAKNKQLFNYNYIVKEYLSPNKSYTIKKLPKSISSKLLMNVDDLKTDNYTDDIKEIQEYFINFYNNEYHKNISNLDVKLSYDGLISCGINRYKQKMTIVLNPDLKNKLNHTKMQKYFTKYNKNPNVKMEVYFQYGKYIPKVKTEAKQEIEVLKPVEIKVESKEEVTKPKSKKTNLKKRVVKNESDDNLDSEVKTETKQEVAKTKSKKANSKKRVVKNESDDNLDPEVKSIIEESLQQ